jgi:hypothetical protein
LSEQRDLDNQALRWGADGLAVHATLTQVASHGVRPDIVLVAGSGPTGRDWESPLLPGSNGSGTLLAGALPKGADRLRPYDATIAAISAGRLCEIDPRLPEGLRTPLASQTDPANKLCTQEILVVDPAELLGEVTESVETRLATQAGLERKEDQE